MLFRSRRWPAGNGGRRRIGRGPHDLIAADALIDERNPVPMNRMQTSRQHVGPAVVAVDRRGRAVGDGIAEGDDDLRTFGKAHLDRVEKEP